VRFLGRRVYAGLVVVLVSAMAHGLKPERVHRLREVLGIDRRTLERWRQWWLVIFVESSFWKEARARFLPPLCPQTLPWSLCLSFAVGKRRDRLLELLKFLAPSPPRPPGRSWLCEAGTMARTGCQVPWPWSGGKTPDIANARTEN
jgi:hypothetical protein